jgi:tetratricopeptide (TPR) repeat protein
MAETTLRAYVKDIDELIEHEQLDEAIAHARHILETYPKHLEAYRLLGKAYLEAKRFGDAADLFQRVLSAIPDDFVSHVGMSIVREDEGNLDASIWHMERAFETNPANPAIQQELRRLIGRRDGLEPAKVRLTRGALARMYAHGELFPQAISELQSALREDSDRPDLQVLLANLYWRTGQTAEAVEVASQILAKLPYCRDANRIVAAGLQAAAKVEEAATYHRRLAALDPYAAFVETAMVEPQAVAADSVRLDRLTWQAGKPLPAGGQPDWAASLGVDLRPEKPATPVPGPGPSWLEESPKPAPQPAGRREPTPTWLKAAPEGEAVSPQPTPKPAGRAEPTPTWMKAAPEQGAAPPQPTPTPTVHPFAGAAAPPGVEIPAWMREAGWAEGTGAAVEGPVSFSDEELQHPGVVPAAPPPPQAELAPAQIPEWLKGVAPSQVEPEAAPPEGGESAEGGPLPGWFGEIGPGAGVSAPEAPSPPVVPPPVPTRPPVKGPDKAEVPTWLEEPYPGATETIVTWLGDRSQHGGAPPGKGAPTWMKDTSAERQPEAEPPQEPGAAPTAPTEEAKKLEQPDWLTEAQAGIPQETGVTDEADWLKEVSGVAAEEQPAEEAPPAWLAGVAASASAAEAEVPEMPDWLQEAPVAESAPEEPEEKPAAATEAPEWIQEIAVPGPAKPAEQLPSQQPVSGESELDWLSGIAEEAPAARKEETGGPEWLRGIAEPAEEPVTKAGEPSAESLDWLRGIAEPEAAEAPAEPPIPDRPKAEKAPKPEAPPPLAEEDWLRSIAEGEPSVEPAPQGPDWLRGIAEPEPSPPAEARAAEAAAEAPGWLRGLAEPEGQPTEEAPVSETADWLRGIAEPEAQPPAEAPVLGAAAPAGEMAEAEPAGEATPTAPEWLTVEAKAEAPAAEGPDWLAAVPEAETPAAAPESGAPAAAEWLAELTTSAPPEAAPTAPSAVEQTSEAAPSVEGPAWLDELRAAGPPTQPEPAAAEAPDWLKDLIQAGEKPGEPLATPPSEDWLQGLIESEGEVPAPTPPAPAGKGAEWLQEFAQPEAMGAPSSQPVPEEWVPGPEKAAPPPPPPAAETVAARGTTRRREAISEVQPPAAPPVTPVPTAAAASEMSEDDVFRWLEDLAARQTSEAAPVSTAPVSPVREPGTPEAVIAPRGEAIPEEPEESLQWLERLAGEGEPSAAAQPSPAGEEAPPDWLKRLSGAKEPRAPVLEPSPGLPAAPPSSAEEVPAWLRMATEEEGAAEPGVTPLVKPPAAQPAPGQPAVEPAWMRAPEVPRPEGAAGEELEIPEWIQMAEPVPKPATPEVPPPAPPVAEAPRAPEVPRAAVSPMPAPEVAQAPRRPEPPIQAEVAPVPAPVVRPGAKPKPQAIPPQQVLDGARQALATGNLELAAKGYATLIKRKAGLDVVIGDLRTAVEQYPATPALWQALGDAYMRQNHVPEAIEAYRRGLASV